MSAIVHTRVVSPGKRLQWRVEIMIVECRSDRDYEAALAKMVEGRLRKSLGEITLLGQAFVKDPDVTI